jgi:hypothetical protein
MKSATQDSPAEEHGEGVAMIVSSMVREAANLSSGDGPPICYEPCRYLSESLSSFLIDLVQKQEKRGHD